MSLLWVKIASPADKYYHRSPHDFQPGDEVTPASERMPMKYPRTPYPEDEEWRANHVWMTGHPEHAKNFSGHGSTYEVEPTREVTDHPVHPGPECAECMGEGGWHDRQPDGSWQHQQCHQCFGSGHDDTYDPVDTPQYRTDRAKVIRKVEDQY